MKFTIAKKTYNTNNDIDNVISHNGFAQLFFKKRELV